MAEVRLISRSSIFSLVDLTSSSTTVLLDLALLIID